MFGSTVIRRGVVRCDFSFKKSHESNGWPFGLLRKMLHVAREQVPLEGMSLR
jgi:hypothetical protein